MTDTLADEPQAYAPAASNPPRASGSAAPLTRLHAPPPSVMRLSPKAVAVLCLVTMTGIGGALYFALNETDRQAEVELLNTNGRTTADAITSGPKDYSQVPKLGQPLPGDLGGPILSAQQRGVEGNMPPVGQSAGQNGQANAAQAARQRAIQERDAARTSRLFLGGGTGGAASAASLPSRDPLAAAAATPPTVAALATDLGTARAPSEDAAQNGQAGKHAFLGRDADRRTVSAERLNGPASPWILQAGSVIPAALITGIRSDLPGQITAQVTQNVYDSPTGRILLIPQGARLLGDYDSEVSFGQNRVLLAWDRLILPGGRSILLERQPGGDGAGYAGLQDGVNYHWGNMAKAALISALLGAGAEIGSGGDDDLTRAIRRGTQDTVNQTGQQIVRRQLNVQPTLTIRPGSPLRVIVTRDLILTPIVEGADR